MFLSMNHCIYIFISLPLCHQCISIINATLSVHLRWMVFDDVCLMRDAQGDAIFSMQL